MKYGCHWELCQPSAACLCTIEVLLRENCKRRIARAVACSSLTYPGGGGYPVLSCPRWWGGGPYPILSCPGWGRGTQSCPVPDGVGVPHPLLGRGGGRIPSCGGWGTPEGTWDQWKYYGMETWDQWTYYGMEMGYPHGKIMWPVEVLWDGDGVKPPHPVWTDWKYYLPSSFGCGR